MFAESLIDMLNFRYLPNTIAPEPFYCDKEIKKEGESRETKRRRASPECSLVYGNKMPKIEESDAYFDGTNFCDFYSRTSFTLYSAEKQCEGTPYSPGYHLASKEEPVDLVEEIIEETAAPVPGRPIGSKNGPRKVQMVNARRKKRHCGEKTAFTYPQMITLALLNSPEEKATVYMIYHFPGIDANSSWKNTLRHALAFENRFQKELPGRSSFWFMVPGRRDKLIRSVKAVVEHYKDDMDALRMRDVAELPSILSGACAIPVEAQNSQDKCAVIEEPRPASDSEFKQNSKQQTYCTTRTANMLNTEQELYSILSTSSPLPEKQRTYPRCQKRLTDGKKPAFKYHHMILMTLLNSPEEKATVYMMYEFVLYHFPGIDANSSWKNTLRHALAFENRFQKELPGRSSFWFMVPGRRDKLIRSVKAVVEHYKDDMDALRMRDVAELPSILSGACAIPVEAQNSQDKCAVIEEPRPASDSEFKQNSKQQTYCTTRTANMLNTEQELYSILSTSSPLPEKQRTYPRCQKRLTDGKKPAFKYHHMILMTLLNSPEEKATVHMMYTFVLHHFPSIGASYSWKNNLRHALTYENGFQKQLFGRSSFWYIVPGRRDELIRSVTEVIVYYKNDMAALGMRDIAELSSILNGTSGIPDRSQHLEDQCVVMEEPCPASDSEFKQTLGQQPWTFYPSLEEPERLYPRHYTRRNHKKKSSFKYQHMIAMALLNSPDEAANVQMIYAFVLCHFPSIDAIASWKNSIRHALMPCYGFEMLIRSVKEEVDANKNNMDALRMRDIAMLPSILSGKCGLPSEAQVSTGIEEHCPGGDGEFPHAFNLVYEQPQSGFEVYEYVKEESLDFEDEKTSPVQQYMLKQDCDPYLHQTALESDISVLRY